MSKQFDPLGKTAPELHPDKDTIIIAGDSWAMGEFNFDTVYHTGLEQYLRDDGLNVVNCGEAGCSNCKSILNLYEVLIRSDIKKERTKIFFFWTDWHRDLCRQYDHSLYGDLVEPLEHRFHYPRDYNAQLPHQLFYRVLKRLEMIAQKSLCSIGLIGGSSDVIDVGDAHPGVYTACQSFTNLCINDIDYTDDPVYSFFTYPEFGRDKFRSKFFLEDLDRANSRRKQWQDNPNWFCSDGIHANRNAYRKLYMFLKEKQYI
jgi:hypothetical protein